MSEEQPFLFELPEAEPDPEANKVAAPGLEIDTPAVLASGAAAAGPTSHETSPALERAATAEPVALAPAGLNANASLADAAQAFGGHMLRQGFSDNTIKAFQADLRLFARRIGSNKVVGKIGQSDLEDFMIWLNTERGTPCSPKSYARRLTTLKVFFGWLRAAEVLDHDPAAPLVACPSDDAASRGFVRQPGQRFAAGDPRSALGAEAGRSALPPRHAAASDGHQEGRVHGDQARAHRPFRAAARPCSLCAMTIRARLSRSVGWRSGPTSRRPTGSTCGSTSRGSASSSARPVIWSMCSRKPQRSRISRRAARSSSCAGPARCEIIGMAMPADQLRQKLGLSMITWRETLPKIQKLAGPAL